MYSSKIENGKIVFLLSHFLSVPCGPENSRTEKEETVTFFKVGQFYLAA